MTGQVQTTMTYDYLCQIMAKRSGARSAEQWDDFFSMVIELQRVEALLIKDAVFSREGPSVFSEMIVDLGVAVTLIADVVGVGTGYTALKALL